MMFKKILGALIILSSFIFAGFVVNSEEVSTKEFEKQDTYNPIVVLELFTSQGCSSCPAADNLLRAIKKEGKENVFVLSYHVDYWNYLGWKDPFSKKEYKDKQSVYNTKFKYRGNYTPELVLNGKTHCVGSSKAKVHYNLDSQNKINALNKIELSKVLKEGKMVQFNYKVSGGLDNKSLRVVLVLDHRETVVTKGENRNRTLKNSNIVVAEKSVQLNMSDGFMEVKLPEAVKSKDNINLIVLVEDNTFDIVGGVQQKL